MSNLRNVVLEAAVTGLIVTTGALVPERAQASADNYSGGASIVQPTIEQVDNNQIDLDAKKVDQVGVKESGIDSITITKRLSSGEIGSIVVGYSQNAFVQNQFNQPDYLEFRESRSLPNGQDNTKPELDIQFTLGNRGYWSTNLLARMSSSTKMISLGEINGTSVVDGSHITMDATKAKAILTDEVSLATKDLDYTLEGKNLLPTNLEP
jgi:hypothetical protein